MAKKLNFVILLHGCETCLDRLVVGHTLRIAALCHADYFLRHHELLLLDHLEVPDDVHCRLGSDEGEFVQFVILEELVLDLDDSLFALSLARKVDSYSDLVLDTLEVEDLQCLVYVFSGYMVQYGTILQCAYYQFFSTHIIVILNEVKNLYL